MAKRGVSNVRVFSCVSSAKKDIVDLQAYGTKTAPSAHHKTAAVVIRRSSSVSNACQDTIQRRKTTLAFNALSSVPSIVTVVQTQKHVMFASQITL